ncbi:MAG: hypothetical protein AABY96_06655 [Nitrospirota bacterium]
MKLTHALVEEARVAKYPNVYVDIEFDDMDVKFVVGNSGQSAAVDIKFDVKDSVPWRKIQNFPTGIKSISAVENGISYLAPGRILKFQAGYVEHDSEFFAKGSTIDISLTFKTETGMSLQRQHTIELRSYAGILLETFQNPEREVARAIRDTESSRRSKESLTNHTKNLFKKACPSCGEFVKPTAKKCIHCLEVIPDVQATSTTIQTARTSVAEVEEVEKGELNMLTHSDIEHLTVPEQLFGYANAYRSSAAVLCSKFESADDVTFCTWPNAVVVLMLTAHAVELFLKGVLLKRTGDKVWSYGHKIDKLAEKYRETFQAEPSFTWDIPFASTLTETEWIAQMKQVNPDTTDAELKNLISGVPDPSILYRYPVNKHGEKWQGLYGFYPPEFNQILSRVECDFDRIRSQLNQPA